MNKVELGGFAAPMRCHALVSLQKPTKPAWLLAILLVSACHVTAERDELRRSVQTMEKARATQQQELDRLTAAQRASQAGTLDCQNRLVAVVKSLRHFGAVFYSSRLQVSVEQDRMLIKLPSPLLFEPGQTELTKQARDDLKQVGIILAAVSGRHFQVQGHADDAEAKSGRSRDALELSAQRAAAVMRLLIAAGVDAGHLSAVAYGAGRPLSKESSDASRRQNRRVELALQPNLEADDNSPIELPSESD